MVYLVYKISLKSDKFTNGNLVNRFHIKRELRLIAIEQRINQLKTSSEKNLRGQIRFKNFSLK